MIENSLLLDRLRALLSDITGAPAAGLSRLSSQEDTRGWDSVANLSFITSIEEEFGVIINTQDVLRLHSLGDMESFLLSHGAHAGPAVHGGGQAEMPAPKEKGLS